MDRTCSTGASGSILDCPICKGVYDDPRILPCQHTICEKCLSSYIRQVTQNGGKPLREFPCPVCERKTNLRDSSAFQRNLTIIALLDSKLLKSRIQKVSTKKKSKAVTIETQTSIVESVADSTEILQIHDSTSLSRCDIKDTDFGNRYASASLKRKNRKIPKVNNRVNKRKNNAAKDDGDNFEVNVPFTIVCFFSVLFGNPIEVFTVLYLLLIYDIILIVIVYFLPALGILLITIHLLLNYPGRSNSLFRESKRWHGFLLANIEWMIHTTAELIQLLLWILLSNLIYTFYRAISDRQSVFTLDVLLENVLLHVFYIIHFVVSINETLTNLISNFLHLFIQFYELLA